MILATSPFTPSGGSQVVDVALQSVEPLYPDGGELSVTDVPPSSKSLLFLLEFIVTSAGFKLCKSVPVPVAVPKSP